MIINEFLVPISPVLSLMLSAILLIVLETIYREEKGRVVKLLIALSGPLISILFVSLFVPVALSQSVALDSTQLSPWLNEFKNSYQLDRLSGALFLAISFFLLLTLVFVESFLGSIKEKTEIFSLLLFAGSGMMLLVSAGNLLMLFMALELMSLPTYILVGLRKNDLRSSEAALKYFLYGSFATVLLVFAIALLYGQFGTLQLNAIAGLFKSQTPTGLATLSAFGLLVAAIGFKVGMAPYHLWVPDAYQGAPTPITGFMGSAIKLAGFGLAIRVFGQVFLPLVQEWITPLSYFSVFTIFVGNLAALLQTDLKRLFAYSSISHAGYLFLGVATSGGNPQAIESLQYYLWIYGLLFLGIFGLLALVETHKKSLELDKLNGLGFQRPVLGFCFLLFLLSAAGIPPTAGFFAKYFVLIQAFQSGQTVAVMLAVLSSLIGVFYYLKVVAHLYMKASESAEVGVVPRAPRAVFLGILLCGLGMLYFSFVPSFF
ncbi:MAG: NADH-quinone oxidoreductase subunit N [Pseudomonadota bacterium]